MPLSTVTFAGVVCRYWFAAVSFEAFRQEVRLRFVEVDHQGGVACRTRVRGRCGAAGQLEVPRGVGPAGHQGRVVTRGTVRGMPVQDAEAGDPEPLRRFQVT